MYYTTRTVGPINHADITFQTLLCNPYICYAVYCALECLAQDDWLRFMDHALVCCTTINQSY